MRRDPRRVRLGRTTATPRRSSFARERVVGDGESQRRHRRASSQALVGRLASIGTYAAPAFSAGQPRDDHVGGLLARDRDERPGRDIARDELDASRVEARIQLAVSERSDRMRVRIARRPPRRSCRARSRRRDGRRRAPSPCAVAATRVASSINGSVAIDRRGSRPIAAISVAYWRAMRSIVERSKRSAA
jgi:hypothetical protein